MKYAKIARWVAPLVGIAVLLAAWSWAAAARHKRATEKRQTEEAIWLAGFQKTEEWQKRARVFDKRKTSAARIFDKADRVEAFWFTSEPVGDEKKVQVRLLGGMGDEKSRNAQSLKDVGFVAKGKEMGPEFAARLGAILLDPKTYPFPGQSDKMCYIDPGMAFRVWSGKQFVDVWICFKCNQLVVMENNPDLPEASIGGWLTGRFAVAGDFDTVRPQMEALVKEAFPNRGIGPSHP